MNALNLQMGVSDLPIGDILLILVAIFLVLTALVGVRVVPQSREYVVTRLGAYNRTLRAGVNFIIPYVERIHSRVSIADQVLNVV